jgi:diguanylate cyclase
VTVSDEAAAAAPRPAAAQTAKARAAAAPASVAKGALRRLAQAQLEPTPENYARAYAEESGMSLPPVAPAALPDPRAEARAQGAAWAQLIERMARNLERGGRQWTGARRKESLQRVLDGSRSDAGRLLQRLQSLMGAWESDLPSDPAAAGTEPSRPDTAELGSDPAAAAEAAADAGAGLGDVAGWPPLVMSLNGTLQAALPGADQRAAALAARLAELADAVAAAGPTPELLAAIDAVCRQARRLFSHHHQLTEQLAALCRELAAGMTDLAEDESWARGQCLQLQTLLGTAGPGAAAQLAAEGAGDDAGLSVRGVRAAGALLAETRQQQRQLRSERQAAQRALRQLIQTMLIEVGELGASTGRFQQATERHVEAIAKADTLESLADVVKRMLEEAREVQQAVRQSQERLQADRGRAAGLEARVRELEAELRRLSEEVSTDALTQVANRRGLMQAFEAEVARTLRAPAGAGAEAPTLAVALIDIDNFKRLNDTLGHAAGDVALRTLAGAVRERLRPVDHLARFGGEEFVVLLPDTKIGEAQQALTRLQRSLTEALFLHDGREVFVTFSAGVTRWQGGESLQTTLARADEALYEAKRTGKNRTCIA